MRTPTSMSKYNPETYKIYYAKNKERIAARAILYAASKKEDKKKYDEERRKKNSTYFKEYEQNKRKRTVEYGLWIRAKSRAKKHRIPFTITLDDVIIPSHCPALNIPLVIKKGDSGGQSNSPSLDRLIPDLGYVSGNVAVISQKANSIKTNASLNEIRLVAAWLEGVL